MLSQSVGALAVAVETLEKTNANVGHLLQRLSDRNFMRAFIREMSQGMRYLALQLTTRSPQAQVPQEHPLKSCMACTRMLALIRSVPQ